MKSNVCIKVGVFLQDTTWTMNNQINIRLGTVWWIKTSSLLTHKSEWFFRNISPTYILLRKVFEMLENTNFDSICLGFFNIRPAHIQISKSSWYSFTQTYDCEVSSICMKFVSWFEQTQLSQVNWPQRTSWTRIKPNTSRGSITHYTKQHNKRCTRKTSTQHHRTSQHTSISQHNTLSQHTKAHQSTQQNRPTQNITASRQSQHITNHNMITTNPNAAYHSAAHHQCNTLSS